MQRSGALLSRAFCLPGFSLNLPPPDRKPSCYTVSEDLASGGIPQRKNFASFQAAGRLPPPERVLEMRGSRTVGLPGWEPLPDSGTRWLSAQNSNALSPFPLRDNLAGDLMATYDGRVQTGVLGPGMAVKTRPAEARSI